MESCENCGRIIGKLETPCVHEDHIVCAECKSRLDNARPAAAQPPPSAPASFPPKRAAVALPAVGNAPIAEFAVSRDQAVQAVTAVVARLGYTLQNVDRANGLVTFETGMSWLSWAGQKMSVHVLDLGDRVQITVGGTRKAHGAQIQLYDWGEAKKIAAKVFKELQSILR